MKPATQATKPARLTDAHKALLSLLARELVAEHIRQHQPREKSHD